MSLSVTLPLELGETAVAATTQTLEGELLVLLSLFASHLESRKPLYRSPARLPPLNMTSDNDA